MSRAMPMRLQPCLREANSGEEAAGAGRPAGRLAAHKARLMRVCPCMTTSGANVCCNRMCSRTRPEAGPTRPGCKVRGGGGGSALEGRRLGCCTRQTMLLIGVGLKRKPLLSGSWTGAQKRSSRGRCPGRGERCTQRSAGRSGCDAAIKPAYKGPCCAAPGRQGRLAACHCPLSA